VVPIVCATTLEARVRELRLIAAEQPRYNIRSKRPQAESWLKLTAEAAPRLSVVKAVAADTDAGARYLGPFTSRQAATAAAEAITLAFPLRTCTTTLARAPRATTPACARAELGTCPAPCTSNSDRDAYAALVEGVRSVMSGDVRPVVDAVMTRLERLSIEERFEDAAVWRDRLSHLVTASVRTHRLAAVAIAEEVVAAAPTPAGGWEIHVIRHGRLAAAGAAEPGADPRPVVEALIATAEHVTAAPAPAPAGLTEEAREILRWLDGAQVRIVASSTPMAVPAHCGGAIERQLAGTAGRAPRRAIGLDDRDVAALARPLGPVDARQVTRMLSA